MKDRYTNDVVMLAIAEECERWRPLFYHVGLLIQSGATEAWAERVPKGAKEWPIAAEAIMLMPQVPVPGPKLRVSHIFVGYTEGC